MSAHTMLEVWDHIERVLLESARLSLAEMWPADPGERAVAIYGTLALRLGLVNSLSEWRQTFASYQARQEQAQEGAP